jgi:hypothetical protein
MSIQGFFAGKGLTVMRNAQGNSLSWKPSVSWKHPWTTTAQWQPATTQWIASVVAGFCNGKVPMVSLTNATAPAPTLTRAKANGIDVSNPTAQLFVPLTDLPLIPMSFRRIGSDDMSGNSIPEFFQKLGVNPGQAFNPDDPSAPQGGPTLPASNRLLRACDFVLQQPRFALSSVITVGDAVVDGYNMIQALNIIAPPAAQVLLVYTTSEWSAPDPQLDIEDGIYQEPTYDEILISTLYLLSPPGTAAGSEPDATWTPYTQHNLFWNLQWAQNTNINQVPQQEVSFVIALPSGIIAQPIVNAILANVNDALDQAEAILAAHTLAGQFWTQGGCSPIAVQASTPGATNYGLNKAAANAAADAAKNQQPAPLDPPFPYTCQPFPPSILT